MGRKGSKMLAPSTLNMLPKFELAPILMYLTMLAKIFRPSITPVLQHHEALFQEDDVGGLAGDVDRRIHRDAHVGGAQRGASLMPSPR